MESPTHHTEVVPVRRGAETNAFVTRCSCGWEHCYSSTKTEAEARATDHVVATRGDG